MEKRILDLFEGMSCAVTGANMAVSGISIDSRKVSPGDIFFAYRGERFDGRDFIEDAFRRGAVAVCTDGEARVPRGAGTVVRVEDVREALARAAARFWDFPSRKLTLVGVTGTNGKTTTAFFLKHILTEAGCVTGLMGTIRNEIGGTVVDAGLTTPEAHEINGLLFRMVEAGVETAIMEVSSQGIDQRRIEGLVFSRAVFTNLSGEHLDYHGTMERYFEAKMRLFRGLAEQGETVANIDDPYGRRVAAEAGRVRTVSLGGEAFLTGVPLSASLDSTLLSVRRGRREAAVRIPRPGLHNCMNALLAGACALSLGVSFDRMVGALETLPQVPGRLEPVECGQEFKVYVDYAHTDNALEKVLGSLRSITEGRIITVFGAGGDRDRKKRPRMGRVACRLSDKVVITSDNPRTEDPEAIIREIRRGTGGREWKVIPDRREAIEAALAEAHAGDVVLIAGKGHEDYQIVGTRKFHFSDREVVEEYFRKRKVRR